MSTSHDMDEDEEEDEENEQNEQDADELWQQWLAANPPYATWLESTDDEVARLRAENKRLEAEREQEREDAIAALNELAGHLRAASQQMREERAEARETIVQLQHARRNDEHERKGWQAKYQTERRLRLRDAGRLEALEARIAELEAITKGS